MKPSDLLALPVGTLLRNGSRITQLRGPAVTRRGTIQRLAHDGQSTHRITPDNCGLWTILTGKD